MSRYTEAILNIVCAEGEHLTAEQVFFRMRENYPSIVLATVYNNLKALYEKGKIRKISVEGFPDRYDGVIPHSHLVCRSCGSLLDISAEQIQPAIHDLSGQLQEERGISVDGYDLKLYCLCENCKTTAKESSI